MSEAAERTSASALLSELSSVVGPLESQRLSVRARALQTLGIIGAALLAVVAGFGGIFVVDSHAQVSPIAIGVAVVLIAVIGSIIWYFRVHGPQSDYTTAFKQTVIGKLVSDRYPGARYGPEQGISQAEYQASRLFAHTVDKFEHEDLIEGRFGETRFRVSEVHSQYKTETTDSEGRTRTHWHTIFKGMFFIADFNKSFQGVTLVLPEGPRPRSHSLARRLILTAQTVVDWILFRWRTRSLRSDSRPWAVIRSRRGTSCRRA